MRVSVLFCACALAMATSAPLLAQGRNAVSVGDSEATIRNPGDISPVSRVITGYYGQGQSGSLYGAPTTNVLGGSLAPPGSSSFTYKGQDRSPVAASPLPSLSAGNREQVYRAISAKATEGAGGYGAVSALLQNIANPHTSEDFNRDVSRLAKDNGAGHEPIKSLVPAGSGLYHDYLESGERAFRDRNYPLAFSKFQMANYIGRKDPESLLSMAHTQFAADCYPLAANYLRQALKYMPRLPMVPLQPKAFYGDPSVYIQDIQDLDDHLAHNPTDPDALLLRAYYAWFDSDQRNSVGIAKSALAAALSRDNSPEVTQAIETFWAGMVATGKVNGPLKVQSPTSKASERNGKS